MIDVSNLPFYVINLIKDSERRARVTEQFNKANLSSQFTFFKAVYGKELTKDELKANFDTTMRYIGPANVLGCALSHVNMWQKAAQLDLDYICICEDDVEFANDFKIKLQTYLNQFSEDFDILYVGSKYFNPNKQFRFGWAVYSKLFNKLGHADIRRVSENIFVPDLVFGTHCYILTRNGYQKLLSKIQGKISGHIDLQIQALGEEINSLCAWEPLAFQESTSTNSTISDVNFPHFLNKYLDTPVEHGFSISYILNCPVAEIYGQAINYWTAISLIIGILLALSGAGILGVLFWFVLFMFLNAILMIEQGEKTSNQLRYVMETHRNNWNQMLYTFLLLIMPAFAVAIYSKRKLKTV